jgi:hypothetical protein
MPQPSRAKKPRAQARVRPAPSRVQQATALAEPAASPEDDIAAREAVQLLSDPRLRAQNPAQRARLLQRLQHGYGNAEVARLIQRAASADPGVARSIQRAASADPGVARSIQRAASADTDVARLIQRAAVADADPATAPPQKLDPHQDPKFASVEHRIAQTAGKEKQHPSARSKAAEAQAAAHGPPDDVASQAAAAEIDKMAQQKPGEFDKKAFVEAVKKAIDAAAPKNLAEVDDFKSSNKAGQVKNEVAGLVSGGKQQAEGAIKQTNAEPPDASRAKPKPVAPMPDEKPGGAPADVGAAQAIPSPKPAAETSMAAGPAEVNHQMAQADVTEDQLKQSNEPQFTDALAAKKTAEEHSEKAPEQYHAAENQVLAKAGGDARADAGSALQGMHAGRVGALAGVTGHKGGAKAQDEGKRAEVAAKIESIFGQTRTEVATILDGLDAKVNTAFDTSEKAAREQFETYVDQRMSAYKDDRYDGIIGKGRWVKDKLMGMPSEVNTFYQEGRTRYLNQMQAVISNVADLVGAELGRARARIAQGRQQVKDYVDGQPKQLQQVAREAEQQISGKFDQLEGDVNDKQGSLVQSLADKYVAARDSLDQRIDELKAENKGLVDAVKDAIGGVIQTIMHLKDMLLNVLSKAANVIGDIIKAPVKFLGNLVGAIKQGLNQFVSNIGTHLQKGLMGWLFGTLGDAGIQLPDSFDLKGIISLVLQILGLTYENVRAIAVKIAGEKVIGAVEGTVKFFTTLAREGPAGLWEWVKDKISDLNIEDMVIGAIKDFVITKIIMAGVTWLIGLLNPAAAFIKACKMIYDVIMFFIERGSQIMEFVNSILDGIGAIVSGSIGAAANLVESSLAKILPLAISFLASLLGVGGIAEKIKEIVEKIRAPINKLITAIVGPLVRPLKKLYDKGAKFVKGVVDKGKALGKKALGAVRGKVKGLFGGSGSGRGSGSGSGSGSRSGADARTEAQQRTDVDSAIGAADAMLSAQKATPDSVRSQLPDLKKRFGLTSVDLVHEDGASYHVTAVINRMATQSHKLTRGGASFNLAPGGIDAHEGDVILTSRGTEREIHVRSRHGREVTTAYMKERLEEVIGIFRQQRARKLEQWGNGLAAASARYGRMSALPQPLNPQQQREQAQLEETLDTLPTKMQWLQSIGDNDRDEIQRFLTDEARINAPFRATKFYNNKDMHSSIARALSDNKDRINQEFTDEQGSPRATGTQTSKLSAEFIQNIGIGYELDENMQVVPIPMMRHVGVIAIISDSEKRLYKVQTAFPEP